MILYREFNLSYLHLGGHNSGGSCRAASAYDGVIRAATR